MRRIHSIMQMDTRIMNKQLPKNACMESAWVDTQFLGLAIFADSTTNSLWDGSLLSTFVPSLLAVRSHQWRNKRSLIIGGKYKDRENKEQKFRTFHLNGKYDSLLRSGGLNCRPRRYCGLSSHACRPIVAQCRGGRG